MVPYINTFDNVFVQDEIHSVSKSYKRIKSVLHRDLSVNNFYNRKQISKYVALDSSNNILKLINSISNDTLTFKDIWINTIQDKTDDVFHVDQSLWSAVVFLNDDFTGGEFQYINVDGRQKTIIPTVFKCVVMNNLVQHRVAPVESGVRKTLVYFFER